MMENRVWLNKYKINHGFRAWKQKITRSIDFIKGSIFKLPRHLFLHYHFVWLSVRTVLLAIIGFMPSKGEGAIGALDYPKKERKILAVR